MSDDVAIPITRPSVPQKLIQFSILNSWCVCVCTVCVFVCLCVRMPRRGFAAASAPSM